MHDTLTRRTTGMVVCAVALLACGEVTTLFGPGGTGGASGTTSSSGDPWCAVDAGCSDAGSRCCAGGTVLSCDIGKYGAPVTCGQGETCDNSAVVCQCVPDGARCLDTHNAQRCEAGSEGPAWKTTPCTDSQMCDKGVCVDLATCPTLGEFACAADGSHVLKCGADHLEAAVLDCKTAGFEQGCVPLPGGGAPDGGPADGGASDGGAPMQPQDLCVNACFVRGVPLINALCGIVQGLPCAVYICSAEGTALAADHIDCRASGQPCTKNEECATCNCQNGFCFGVTSGHCPAADPYKCK